MEDTRAGFPQLYDAQQASGAQGSYGIQYPSGEPTVIPQKVPTPALDEAALQELYSQEDMAAPQQDFPQLYDAQQASGAQGSYGIQYPSGQPPVIPQQVPTPALDEAGRQELYNTAMQAVQPVGKQFVPQGQQQPSQGQQQPYSGQQGQPPPTAADFAPAQTQQQAQPSGPAQKSISDSFRDLNRQYQQTLNVEKDVNTKIAASKIAEIDAKDNILYNHQRELEKINDQMDLAERTAQGNVEKASAARAKAVEQYREAITPEALEKAFRPHALFEDASTGQAVLGAIAIGLGGIGAAMQGGNATNQALAIIQKRVDKENEMRASAQRSRISGLEQSAESARQDVGIARQQKHNELAAINNRKIMQIEMMQAKVNQISGQYQGEQIKQNAVGLNQGLERMKLGYEQQNINMQLEQERMKALAGLTHDQYDKMSPVQRQMVPEAMRKDFQHKENLRVPGYGYAKSAPLAEQINKDRPEMEEGIRLAEQLYTLSKTKSKFLPYDRAEMQSKMLQLMGPMRVKLGLGVMSEADKGLVKAIVGEPSKIWALPGVEQRRVKEILSDLKTGWHNKLKGAGLEPKQQNDAATKFGATKPKF